MANKDIQLIVGANIQASKQQLKEDITALVNQINGQKNFAKIKLDIQLDNKTQIRSKLTQDIKTITDKLTSSQNTTAKIKLEIDKSYIERQYRDVISKIAKGKFANIGGLSLISSETLDKTKADAQQLKQIIAEFQKGTLSDKTIKLLGIDSSKLETDVKKVEDVAKRLANANKNLTTASKGIKGIQGGDVSDLVAHWKELQIEIERAHTLEGEEKATAVAAIESKIGALQQEIVTRQGLANIAKVEGRTEVEAAEKAASAQKESLRVGKDKAKALREETSAYSKQLTLIKQIQDYLRANTKINGTVYGNQLNSMLGKLNSGKTFNNQELAAMGNNFKVLKNNITAAGLAGKSFTDTIAAGLKKFSSWFGISQLVMRGVQGVREMITTVTELDTAMTELKKVTDLTEQEYAQFGNTATGIAKTVGATVSDTINSAADFARLGYSIEESTQLAQAALVYKNVGDGINDIGEASESIISTIKAFGIEAENAMGIVDRFNEVGNNFAISSEGIGIALKKSAASLATSGNSIEESIGLATGMNTVIQNPETVGTALKTLTMYLRASKAEAQEAGEETEGMANSVAELQESILTLTNGKVDIMADANNFKSTYQIMKEISEVWGSMAEVDQAALLKLIAGKRNANVVTSLITNFKDAEEAMKVASEATGSATAENEKYLDSIEGRKAKLKATFESISSDVFESDFLKGVITSLTTILDLADKIISNVGTLPTLIGTISAALSLKNVGLFKLVDSESSLSGKKLQGQFPLQSLISSFTHTDAMSFGTGYETAIAADTQAFNNYVDAVKNGTSVADAFQEHIVGASPALQNYAQGIRDVSKEYLTSGKALQSFINQQNLSQVALMAQDKSFRNCKSIINEYNTDCKNVGVSQADFVQTVGTSNQVMGKYLSGLNGASAGMGGYTKALIGAKLQTIGLQVASMALNAVISMGVTMAIQLLIQLADELFVTSKEAIQAGEDAQNAISEIQSNVKNAAQTIDDYTDRFIELSKGVDSVTGKNLTLSDDDYKEFLDISNRLAETFPTLSRQYDENGNAIVRLNGDAETITGTLNQLLETERQLADQQIVEKLPDVFDGVKAQSEKYEAGVKMYKDIIDGAQNADNVISKLSFSDGGLVSYVGKTYDEQNMVLNNLLDVVDSIGYSAEYLSDEFDSDGNIIGFNYRIVDQDGNAINSPNFKTEFARKITDAINSAERNLAIDTNANKANWAKLSSSIISYLNTSDAYNVLSDEAQSAMQMLINNIDYSQLDFSSWDDLQKYIDNKLIPLFDSNSDAYNNDIVKFIDIQTRFNNNGVSVDEYKNAINTISGAIDNLSDLNDDEKNSIKIALDLDDNDYDAKIQRILENSSNAFTDKTGTYLSEQGIEIKNWLNTLSKTDFDIIAELSMDTESAEWDLETWKSKLEDQVTINAAFDFDAKETEESFANIQKAIQESFKNTSGLTEDSQNNIFAMFGDDPDLLDRTATGIRLNTTRLKELQDTQKDIKREQFDKALSTLYGEYNDLTKQIQDCGDVTSDEYDALVSKRNAIVDKINDISDLQAEYEGLTSAYAEWQAALANGEDGDMYDSIRTEYEKAKELFDKNLVGTSEFESYMKLLTGKDWSNASFDEIKKGWIDLDKEIKNTGYSVKDFLGDNEQGVMNFLNAAAKINGSGVTKKNGLFSIDIDNTAALAEKLGVSVDFVESMLTKLRDYKFNIDFKSETESLEKLTTTAQEASENLRALKLTDVKFDFTTTNDESLNSQLEEAKRLFDSIKNEDGTINMKADGASDIITVYKRLLTQKQQLDSPIVMDVDISKIKDTDIAEDIKEIQDYIRIHNKIQVEAALGHDTTELQNQLAEKLKAISKDNKILAGLDIDEKTSYEDIVAKVDKWSKKPDNAKILVGAGVDESRLDQEAEKVREYIQNAVDGIQIELKFDNKYLQGLFGVTLTVDADTSDADSKLDNTQAKKNKVSKGTKTKVTADTSDANKKLDVTKSKEKEVGKGAKAVVTADTSDASSKLSTIVGYLRTIVSKIWNASVTTDKKKTTNPTKPKTTTTTTSNSRSKLNGTIKGKSNASGNIGAKQTEVALMGEVAPELWVHADTGTWELVDKPQFRKVKKGDVIFNGNQTERLLKQGVIDSYGRSFLSGTAYLGATGSGSDITSSKDTKSTTSTKDNKSTKKKTTKTTSNKKNEKDPTVFDWIEVAIDRIERKIKNLARVAESSFKSLATRLSYTKDEIKAINSEINTQDKGYARYIKEAKDVSRPSGVSKDKWNEYKEKVRNGKISISEIKNESLAKALEEYKKYYDLALKCKDATKELKEERSKLYLDQFNLIAEDYDSQIGLIEHLTKTYDIGIEKLQAKGLIGSTKYLQAKKKAQQDTKATLQNDLADLQKALSDAMNNGEIKKGSKAWYEMQNEINATKEAIEESELAVLELDKAIRELDWEYFEFMQSQISRVASEGDFLINTLSRKDLYNDDGAITNEGQAVMGLHGMNYNVYMAQANAYKDEIADINKELANDPNNKDLIDQKNSLVDAYQDAISSALDEKDAIKDLVEDGIQREIDSLNDLIDKYKDSLDSAKDLYDYQKKIKNQSEDVAKLQKRLSAYEGDTSEENKSTIQKLRLELENAQEDLEETEYEHMISEQKAMLDDLSSNYEEILNERLDDIDGLIQDVINSVNDNQANIYNTLLTTADDVGYVMSGEMDDIWSNTQLPVLSDYHSGFTTTLTTISDTLTAIQTSVNNMKIAAEEEAEAEIANTTPTTQPTKPAATTNTSKPSTKPTTKKPTTSKSSGNGKATVGEQVTYKSGKYHASSDGTGSSGSKNQGKKVYITKIASGSKYPYHISTGKKLGSGDLGWVKLSQISGYASGGYVGEMKNITAKNGDNLISINTLKKGEAVLTPEQAKQFSKLVSSLPYLRDLIDIGVNTDALSQVQPSGNTIGEIQINIPIERVIDYNDFVSQLQKDRQFEKLVRSMSTDLLAGKSSLSKNKYKW